MRPSWERQQDEQEQDYQRNLKRQGELEQQRMAENRYYDGDFLGMDDGRPGIGTNATSGLFGNYFTGGLRGEVLWYVVGAVAILLIIVLGQFLKSVTGYESEADRPAPTATSE